jgi:hypothetical protein
MKNLIVIIALLFSTIANAEQMFETNTALLNALISKNTAEKTLAARYMAEITKKLSEKGLVCIDASTDYAKMAPAYLKRAFAHMTDETAEMSVSVAMIEVTPCK